MSSDEEIRVDPARVLPVEMVHVIFSFLGPRDLASSALVCSRWRHIAGSDVIWRRKCSENAMVGFREVSPPSPSSALLPPLGKWALYYRECFYRGAQSWVKNQPLSFSNSGKSKRHVIFHVHTDARTLAITYMDNVQLFDLTACPTAHLQSLELETGHISHRRVYVVGNVLVIKDRTSLKAYRREGNKFSFHSEIDLKGSCERGLETKEIVFTPEYVYIVLSECNLNNMKIHVWCTSRLRIVETVHLPEGHDAWFSGGSFFFLNSNGGNVTVRTGHKELNLELGMTLSKFRSNSDLITFLGRDTIKGVFRMIVFNHKGECLWKEESDLEFNNIQPLKYWGFCYRVVSDGDEDYCWVIKSFHGLKRILKDKNILGRPRLINSRYLLYQNSLELCIYDLEEGKTLHRNSTCSYFSFELVKDCIVFHDSYSFNVLCYRDEEYF